MKKRFTFGMKNAGQSAPKWVQRLTTVSVFLFTAKSFVINGLPGITPEHAELAGAWWDYVLNGVNVGCGILMIFLGEEIKVDEESSSE